MRPSLSCSVWRVKKLLPALVPTAVVAATLAGCNVMDVAGPRPNKELVSLARQAEADAQSGDEGLRELRRTQAEQLTHEALRLCGTEPSGDVPQTCDVTIDAAGLTPETLPQLLEASVAAAGHLPDESVDLVVAQAVDALATQPVELATQELSLDDASLGPARSCLEQEYALLYGLGLAKAYADDTLSPRIVALQSAASERAEALEGALGAAASGPAAASKTTANVTTPGGTAPALPVPAAGYQITDGAAPTNAAEAADLVERMQREVVGELRLAAARAEGDAWRTLAIQLAAQAQRAAA